MGAESSGADSIFLLYFFFVVVEMSRYWDAATYCTIRNVAGALMDRKLIELGPHKNYNSSTGSQGRMPPRLVFACSIFP